MVPWVARRPPRPETERTSGLNAEEEKRLTGSRVQTVGGILASVCPDPRELSSTRKRFSAFEDDRRFEIAAIDEDENAFAQPVNLKTAVRTWDKALTDCDDW